MVTIKQLPNNKHPDGIFTYESKCGTTYTALREDFVEQNFTVDGKKITKIAAVVCPVCKDYVSLSGAESLGDNWSLPFHARWPRLTKIFPFLRGKAQQKLLPEARVVK